MKKSNECNFVSLIEEDFRQSELFNKEFNFFWEILQKLAIKESYECYIKDDYKMVINSFDDFKLSDITI